LGVFGGPHIDCNDAPAAFTAMISNCNIPSTYEPGCFHIIELGMYIVLDSFVTILFSGLRRHGGTSPIGPRNFPPVPWAYRINVILYPSNVFVENAGVTALAAFPHYRNIERKGFLPAGPELKNR
jgi:hypothetical protein